MSNSIEMERIREFAVDFAEWLIVGKYKKARSYLSASVKGSYPTAKLQSHFEDMVEGCDIDCAMVADEVYVRAAHSPPHEPSDIGRVFVPIFGDDFNEGIFVIINVENGELGIREIEWGRP